MAIMVLTMRACNMSGSILLEDNMGIHLIRYTLHLKQGIKTLFFIAIKVTLTVSMMKS